MACRYLRDDRRTDALERVGLWEAAPGAKVCQHFEGEKCMWRVRVCSSFFSFNSFVYKPSAAPNFRTLSWQTTRLGETRSCWDHRNLSLLSEDGTLSIVLLVEPEVFGKALPGALGGTTGEGDEFSWLDLWKMTLPSSSSRQGGRVKLQRLGLGFLN
ncbi:hypothetical protein GOBAR_AA25306 [Gossypium barbadense]|uniref:Uncharacterized protein n=1 Tax=Gossypium barbadense TaxID=3634 RepID=A0A2P5WW92_GOSBA|nr:hypothetical protein GOBAR_AA25306 [Gossypium barbadense]